MLNKIVDSKKFDQIINSDKPVLIDFFAIWCGPCQMMKPIIEEIAKEAKGFEVVELNIDELPEVAAKYNVLGVPTFIVFREGQEITRFSSSMPKELLIEKVQSAIKK